MSILNLGRQCVGFMREKMSDDREADISASNNLSQPGAVARSNHNIVPALLDSIAPVKILLSTVFQRLQLHDKKFALFTAASNEDRLRNFWSELEAVDLSLKYGGVYRKPQLKELARLNAFMQHCCQSRHHSIILHQEVW